MKLLRKSKPKIFCIGAGKTGTTSVEKVLRDFGYKLGNQKEGELLINEYANRNFNAIINFCKTAEAFQDAPFCFQHTFIALDQYFKDSKFILTIRDSDDMWYNSFVNSHIKKFGQNKNIPSWTDLENANYRYKGYVGEVRKKVFGISEDEAPYDEIKLKQYYNAHNIAIKDYFKNKSNLLTINVSDDDSYIRLCEFIGKKPLYDKFPWENKTSKL